MPVPEIHPINSNLRALVWQADDNPRALIIHVQAKDTEEPASFEITTSAPILSHFWEMPSLKGGRFLMLNQLVALRRLAIGLDQSFLHEPFIIGLELDVPSGPAAHLESIRPWDGSGGEVSMIYIENPE